MTKFVFTYKVPSGCHVMKRFEADCVESAWWKLWEYLVPYIEWYYPTDFIEWYEVNKTLAEFGIIVKEVIIDEEA